MGVRLRKKPDGWYLVINHKSKRKTKKVGPNKAEATEAARRLRIRLGAGEPLWPEEEEKEVPTLEEYFDNHFSRTYLAAGVRPRTRDIYRGTFEKHIKPIFGSHKLNQISREESKRFVADLVEKKFTRPISAKKKKAGVVEVERTLARTSIRIIMANFCSIMNHAKEDGWIIDNPAARLSRHYREAHVVHEEIQPLDVEEVTVFLETALKHSPEYYPLFLMAIHTGMRAGELLALQWSDIDWNSKFALVRHSATREGGTAKTKTGKSRRVDLSDTLIMELQALFEKNKAKFLRARRGLPPWVFTNTLGQQLDLHNVRNRHFYRCLRLAGLRRIRFHDLRHTFATLLIMQGESMAYVKDQMGHKNITMTVNTYTHWIPGSNRAAVNKLPALQRGTTGNVLKVKIHGARKAR